VKKVTLVYNPISGRGKSQAAAEKAAGVLRRAEIDVDVRETRVAGDGRRFARELSPDSDALIAVGGDGTLNEVVSGLTRDVPVGLVPVGTANVVARDLRLPFHPEEAARVIVHGTTRTIDVGRVNDRRFLAMVGVGFDGEIVKEIAAARRGPISQLTYVRPAMRALASFQPRPLRLTVDGVPLPDDFYAVFVTNTRCYGGHFAVAPEAALDDGVFHFAAWTARSKARLLRYAFAGLLRRKASAAQYGTGRRFRIDSVEGTPVPAQADGDPLGATPLDIEVLPRAARVFAPPVGG
jgi:diacylglycerol kinase (ATP)